MVKYNKFKVASGEFRRGEIDGITYYNTFVSVVGSTKADYLLPLLLCILPDPDMAAKLQDAVVQYQEKINRENAERKRAIVSSYA